LTIALSLFPAKIPAFAQRGNYARMNGKKQPSLPFFFYPGEKQDKTGIEKYRKDCEKLFNPPRKQN